MANFSINKLSEKDIKKSYIFICLFEKELRTKYGSFDFNNIAVSSFCKENKIEKKVKRNTKPTENYFWFDTSKIKGFPNNDFAHNLLRHIRNTMAHGNFRKERGKKSYYILEDYNKNGEQTMYGRIKTDLFWKYLNLVLHSSPLVDKNINFDD